MEPLVNQIQSEADKRFKEGHVEEAKYLLNLSALTSLGSLALNSPDITEAKKYMKMALDLDRKNWITWGNYAHLLNYHDQYEEALEVSNTALSLRNHEFSINFNHAVILLNCLRIPEAIDCYRKALQLESGNGQVNYNLATALLLDGQYEEGWSKYRYRFQSDKKAGSFNARFTKPRWDGSKFKGKLCVYSEQGIGDLFQFCRYLPRIKGEIVCEVQEVCMKLLQSSFPDTKFIGRGDGPDFGQAPDCDLCVSFGDLPFVFQINSEEKIKDQVFPYLRTNTKAPFFIGGDKRKIGFCWAGSTIHGYDYLRSCYLKDFEEIAKLPDVILFSLQKGDGLRTWKGKQISLKEGAEDIKFIDLEPCLKTFDDTASLVNEMDLIITIDSSVAHLAGAMGKPTWLLLPRLPDWRWLLNREDTPWYPSVRLFRPSKLQDWKSIFDKVIGELSHI